MWVARHARHHRANCCARVGYGAGCDCQVADHVLRWLAAGEVVGASYILGAETGDIATVVNFFRIALLTLAMAIAALGIKTALGQLAQSGWRPFVLILTAMLWLTALPLMSALFYADFSLYLSVV